MLKMLKKSIHINNFRYYIFIFVTAVSVLFGVSCFNAFIDPFNMYNSLKVEGININKPAVYSRMRLYKAFEVKRVKPQTIILGSSRTHLGISCKHEALQELDKPCYNLAFDGATAKEMYYYLLHANAISSLKNVILGLDLYHISFAPANVRSDFDDLLLYSGSLTDWLKPIAADLRVISSFDAIYASIQTIVAQSKPEPLWFSSDGQRIGEVFFRRVQPTFVKDGARAYFDEIDRQEIRDQIQPEFTSLKKRSLRPSDPNETSISYVKRIIEFCRDKNIDLRIFITPSHAHQSEISAALWEDDSLTSGKRSLVEILTYNNLKNENKLPIKLFDFSGYSVITTEDLPPEDSKKEMDYYWDSSHFKQVVGDYVLDRLFNITPDNSVVKDFGVELKADNIDAILEKQKLARIKYRKEHFAEIAKLRSLISGLPILVYHQILSEDDEKADKSTSITVSEFEKQMRYLHDHGYRTLSMDEVINYLNGDLFPPKIVAIHFDDGWQSTKHALPVLKKFGFKASFWIISGTGDTGWPHMNWDMIKELAKEPYIDIYPHTMTHPWEDGNTLADWVANKKINQAMWELSEAKKMLEKQLNRPMPYMAWPRGIYNDELVKMAQKAGYKALLTIDDGFNYMGDNPLFIRRTMISGGCGIDVFRKTLADGHHRDCK